MSVATKVRIMVMVTLLLSIGFALMGGAPVGRAVLVIVWLGHVAHFVFGVKTARRPWRQALGKGPQKGDRHFFETGTAL